MKSNFLKFVLGLALCVPVLARAETKTGQILSATAKASPEDETFAQIRLEYAQGVEPIFKQSCFNCHSRFVKYPWNYGLPFVKKKIDEDLVDARERLELSDGFPLESRTDGAKHLKALVKVVRRKSMPPFEYMLFHWGSGLSDEDSAKVIQWAESSMKKLLPSVNPVDKELMAQSLSGTAKIGP
jgi:hypothetical protein